jgi:hypothetical protein
MNLVVEANRIAYSCFGKVTSINGQAETSSDILVEAVGVRSNLPSLIDTEVCKTSRENSQLDEFGAYRIRNLKPNCVYELNAIRKSPNSGNNNNNNDSGNQLRIVPNAMQVTVGEADVLNQNFVILTKFDRVDISVAVSYRQSATAAECAAPLNYRHIGNFARVKLFKTSQPDRIIQTLYTPANSVAYLNYLPRGSSGQQEQYSVLVELLMQSSVSPYTALTQQQQAQLQAQVIFLSYHLNLVKT